jgi:uncharacterized protein (DUF2237 family)
MRAVFAAVGLLAILATPTFYATPALAAGDAMKVCAASWQAMAPADKAKTTYKAFSSVCLKKGAPVAAMTPMTAGDRMKSCAAKWNAMKVAGTAKDTTYAKFNATCLKK